MTTTAVRWWTTLIAAALVACSSATRRPADGDGDADADGDADPCPDPDPCRPGFEADWDIDVSAEVAEAGEGRVVLLGDDGQPLTFATCGLAAGDALRPGERLRASNRHPEGWADCWIGELWREDALVALAADCAASGEVTPPLTDLGWSFDLVTDCEGAHDEVCAAGGSPVHLVVPERTFDAEVTAPSGAREDLVTGRVTGLGEWRMQLVDARATDAVEEGSCFEPAAGTFRFVAIATPTRPACPVPDETARYEVGLDISASRTERRLIVEGIDAAGVDLVTEEGTTLRFGWRGPDPDAALTVGQEVTARRYDWDVTRGGFLDVIEADGRVALAAIRNDTFMLELPDLTVIGLELELGVPCEYEEGVAECSGETLIGLRYPVRVTTEGERVTIDIGDTAAVGSWEVSVLDASQHPGVWCPEMHVEAWGPFGLTAMQARAR